MYALRDAYCTFNSLGHVTSNIAKTPKKLQERCEPPSILGKWENEKKM